MEIKTLSDSAHSEVIRLERKLFNLKSLMAAKRDSYIILDPHHAAYNTLLAGLNVSRYSLMGLKSTIRRIQGMGG